MIQKHPIQLSEFKNLKARIEKISLALMKHENKNYAKIGFPISNYRKVSLDNKPYYYVGSNIFLITIETVLTEAMELFPKNFGNNNAVTVLHALNKTRFLHNRQKDANRIYGSENFIYIFDNEQDGLHNKILRLDLFRRLDKIPILKRKYEFTGGVFHALKHFSKNNKPLSTGNEINNLCNPEDIIFLTLKAFFIDKGVFKEDKVYIVEQDYNLKYNLRYVFFLEIVTQTYFLSTIYRVKKKKK